MCNYPAGADTPTAPWNLPEPEDCNGDHRWNKFGDCEGCEARRCVATRCANAAHVDNELGRCAPCELAELAGAVAYYQARNKQEIVAELMVEVAVWTSRVNA